MLPHGIEQRDVEGGHDRVGALAVNLGDAVPGDIDHVDVVADAADQAVGPRPAVEDVVAGAAAQGVGQCVAGEDVVQGVAGEVEGNRIDQGAVLDVLAQRVGLVCRGDADLDQVDALSIEFGDLVAGVVQQIGVVARTADQRVVAQATVEDVVPIVAGQDVVAGVARQVEFGAAGGRGVEVLQVGAQGQRGGCGKPKGSRRAQCQRVVGAFVEVLRHHVLQYRYRATLH